MAATRSGRIQKRTEQEREELAERTSLDQQARLHSAPPHLLDAKQDVVIEPACLRRASNSVDQVKLRYGTLDGKLKRRQDGLAHQKDVLSSSSKGLLAYQAGFDSAAAQHLSDSATKQEAARKQLAKMASEPLPTKPTLLKQKTSLELELDKMVMEVPLPVAKAATPSFTKPTTASVRRLDPLEASRTEVPSPTTVIPVAGAAFAKPSRRRGSTFEPTKSSTRDEEVLANLRGSTKYTKSDVSSTAPASAKPTTSSVGRLATRAPSRKAALPSAAKAHTRCVLPPLPSAAKAQT